MLRVLFVTTEAYPFMKTGGLADVCYALPKALQKLEVDARVIMPKYMLISENHKKSMEKLAEFSVPLSWRNQYCGLEYLEYDGIPFYFIDNEYYFKRSTSYGHYDDGERFSYFCRAVLESIKNMPDFVPDIIQCNDWQSGMVAPLIQAFYKDDPRFSSIKTIFTIHNLKYQGIYPEATLSSLLGLSHDYFTEDKLKFYDCISFMKGGINFSNMITTVSKSYAEEIKFPFYGEGLDGLLNEKSDRLVGIENGIDPNLYDPKTNKDIFYQYSSTSLDIKLKNKEELQTMLGLKKDLTIPLIGIVSRLVAQKGLDLIDAVMEDIMKLPVQIVILGTGDMKYEFMFRYYADKYPGKISANLYFDETLANKIYAASDLFLMPSLFEPCGIGQLIALRYGSLPIVRETGGLKDTVHSYDEATGTGNGFSFANYNAHDMLYTIKRALALYQDKKLWNEIVAVAMEENMSWEKSAAEYKALYSKI
ncbi:MAG TPA: glycogen synthase GlgA [Clostridiaceae bacterium]